jgi:hypothetical protein
MDNRKIRLIFFPFVIGFIGFVLVYTFLHWLLVLKLSLVEINEKYIDYWIPFVLSFVISIWYNKRVDLLLFKNERIEKFYWFISILLFACLTVVVQPYLRDETGEILKVKTSQQITLQNPAKYYVIDSVVLDKKLSAWSWDITHSGRNNQVTNFHGYCVLPIFNSDPQSTNGNFLVWYCKEYKGSPLGSLDEDEKFVSFQECIRAEFSRDNLYEFRYFTRVGPSDKYTGFLKALEFSPYSYDARKIILLEPSTIPFEVRNGDRLKWIIVIFVLSIGIWYFMVLYLPIDEQHYKNYLNGKNNDDAEEAI